MGECVVNVFIAFSCFWMVRYWVVRKGGKKADNFVLTWILTCLATHMKLCLLLWTFLRTCRYVVWTAIERERERERGKCFLWLALAAPNPCKMMFCVRRESTLWLQQPCVYWVEVWAFFSQPTPFAWNSKWDKLRRKIDSMIDLLIDGWGGRSSDFFSLSTKHTIAWNTKKMKTKLLGIFCLVDKWCTWCSIIFFLRG